VTDHNAASGQQLVDHAQAQGKAEVEPLGVADDLSQEPIPGVGRASGSRYLIQLTGLKGRRNPSSRQFDGAIGTVAALFPTEKPRRLRFHRQDRAVTTIAADFSVGKVTPNEMGEAI